jgi:hypothetical protein
MARAKKEALSISTSDEKQMRALVKQMETRRKGGVPKAKRVSELQLLAQARTQLTIAQMKDFPRVFPAQPSVPTGLVPLMELTARAPWSDVGNMDSYHPGRWDTESNLVFMSPIVQVGPSVGEWDGTVIYVKFRPPAAGTYLVASTFGMYTDPSVGSQVQLDMHGPWGTASTHGPTTEPAAITALWSANAGQTLGFSVTCVGGIMAYLQSVRLYPLN